MSDRRSKSKRNFEKPQSVVGGLFFCTCFNDERFNHRPLAQNECLWTGNGPLDILLSIHKHLVMEVLGMAIFVNHFSESTDKKM